MSTALDECRSVRVCHDEERMLGRIAVLAGEVRQLQKSMGIISESFDKLFSSLRVLEKSVRDHENHFDRLEEQKRRT